MENEMSLVVTEIVVNIVRNVSTSLWFVGV